MSAVPAVVAVCILFGFSLKLLPKDVRSPPWSRAFVEEPKGELEEVPQSKRPSLARPTIFLFAFSVIGLALQTLTIFHPDFRIDMIFPAASWAVGTLLIAICRPNTAPKTLLVLYVSILATQAIVLVDSPSKLLP